MTRVILDEGVPRSLARRLRNMGVETTPFPNGMKQLSNGRLLAEIERQGFNVLLTNDKRMRFQQNLTGRSVAVVSLPTNIRAELLAILPQIAAAMRQAEVGRFTQMLDPEGEGR